MAVWPAWEVREDDGATSWYTVRLSFPDGACGEVLAVVSAGRVSVEDVRAQPALSLVDLTMLADWIEGPLFETCGGGAPEADAGAEALEETRGPHRARPAWPRGVEGRRLVAQEYRAAREEGVGPVLAVMCATGRSRRRSLRLIAQARDAGLLAPRHARR